MSLNCKQGDLAIIVKSQAGNEGKIVVCDEFLGDFELLTPSGCFTTEPCWKVNIQLSGSFGFVDNIVEDSKLRPIRDSDKEDEMLSIVNLKEKVKA